MKTLVLSIEDLKSLPIEMAEILEKIVDQKEVSLKVLKDRIAALKHAEIHYRHDIRAIDARCASSDLIFDVWQKTNGEQWGNNCGATYTIKIGRKYITATGEGYASDRRSWPKGVVTINASKLANIVRLLELSEDPETDENDIDQLTIKAVNQFRFFAESED